MKIRKSRTPQRAKEEGETPLPGHSPPVGALELINSPSNIVSAMETLHTEAQHFKDQNFNQNLSLTNTAVAVCHNFQNQFSFHNSSNLTEPIESKVINLEYYFHLLSQLEKLKQQIKQVETKLNIKSTNNLVQESSSCPVS